MTVLAIDTTTDEGSVALLRNGELVFERAMQSSDGFSHVLFRELAGIELGAVDVFAGASGPGSFTGVRVSLATVKGLAEATGKGAVGVSNLEAMATFGSEPLRAVLIDARRGDCYAAVYDEQSHIVSEEVVTRPESWIEALPGERYEFIGLRADWVTRLLAGTRFASMRVTLAGPDMAAAVARCAARRVSLDPAAVDANYVRRSDVQNLWHDRP